MGCGLIAMGETLSTGGNDAQGDLAGAGAGFVLVAVEGFSVGVLAWRMAAFWACCLSAFAPNLSTVALGPIEGANCGATSFKGVSGFGVSSEGVSGFAAA